jgi:hypothetical protein
MTIQGHQGVSLSNSIGTVVEPTRPQQSDRFSMRSAYFVAYELSTFM